MAASFPHFLYGDDVLKTYVDGLQPQKQAHDSFVIVEPVGLVGVAKTNDLIARFAANGYSDGIKGSLPEQSSH